MAAISPNVSSEPQLGTGSKTDFAFNFSIVAATDIGVYVDGVRKSHPSDYTVIFGDVSGTATFTSPPPNGAEILLVSEPDYLQTSEFADQGAYNLSTVNTINRRAAIRELVNHDLGTRALKVPLGQDAEGPEIPLSNVASIVAVGDSLIAGEDIPSVAGALMNVGLVAGSITNVNTVAGIHAAVSTVAGISAAVTTVVGISANVTTLASVASNITTLAPIAANITTVAGISGNVTTVAGIAATVAVAAGNTANITTVAGNAANINAVAADMELGAGASYILRAPQAAIDAVNAKNLVISMLPPGRAKERALRQQPGTFNTTGSLGGGYTKTNGQQTFATYHLSVEDLAARTAGLLFTVKIPVVTGSLTAAQITQKNVGTIVAGPTAMTIENGYAISRGVTIDPNATLLYLTGVTAGSAGVTVDEVGVSYGEPATPQTENALLAAAGLGWDAADAVPFVRPDFLSYQVLAGATPIFNSIDGLVAPLTFQGYIIVGATFEVDQLYTLYFRSPNLPNDTSPFSFLDLTFDHQVSLFTVAPLPKLRKIHAVDGWPDLYYFQFYANQQGAYPMLGVALRINNIAPLTSTVTASDFRLVKGGGIPTRAKSPAVVLDDARRVMRNASLAGAGSRSIADQTKLTVWGSSIAAGYNGLGGAASSWPAQLQALITANAKTCTVTDRGVRGATTKGTSARSNAVPAIVTVVGGSIPGTATAVDLTFSPLVDFFSAFSVADGVEPMTAVIAGRAGTISRIGAVYKFTPIATGQATAVASPVPVYTDMGKTARGEMSIVELGRNDEFSPWLIPRSALPDYMMPHLEKHIDFQSPALKYVIANPPLIGLADADRLTTRRDVDTRYKAMLAAMGLPILDFNRSMTATEITYLTVALGYSMTGQDTTDDGNGLLITGLRQADGLHQNLLGNKLLAFRAFNLLSSELGWL